MGKRREENLNALVKKRLIACANIFPINSMYWWKGKIVNYKESVIIAKTLEKNFKKVINEVKKNPFLSNSLHS